MVGERLRELRMKKGYSISELAELAGVSKSYLSYIERDVQKNPSLQFLRKIATTLETEVEDLLGTPSEMQAKKLIVDDEWNKLLNKAILEGMSKKDFIEFRDYLKFRKWKDAKNQKTNPILEDKQND
ncbi:helix-turn-helix domain-containing protein [Metabacillus sediminilitoris]|uniref:Helix-turn-helix domain-containing protein n=1 Tax=Metabacillus sediminilitoris TaxID=2567941 RepID=A0A4S4BZ62_9BACI|nr:helix-turn-helix transcriptional regulator [Metabacillus sediminilitoris]QGQ47235.1 helix-turn-helix domain-containing protein [Metabacillus sediminilitoris]THF80577.1 helix-turn-helix domain-containing protein [Metabacillus sediminilitoris]